MNAIQTTDHPTMTSDEARQCIDAINHHMASARALVHDLYTRKGWKALGYDSWRACVVAEFPQGENYLYRLLNAAEVEDHLLLPMGKIPERHLRPLTPLTPDQQREVWAEAQATAPNGKMTARHVDATVQRLYADAPAHADVDDEPLTPYQAEVARMYEAQRPPRCDMALNDADLAWADDTNAAHTRRIMGSSASPEWYTPSAIIERVQAFFGDITLDPCSNSKTAPNVPAATLYTREDDGLSQPWRGNVYLNPPYGRAIPEWINRLVEAYESGEIAQAIALLPARVDTHWFQPLYAYLMCNVRGRITFQNAENAAPFPCVIVYLGSNSDHFINAFRDLGPIMRRIA
ncbi:MAG: phage N-6-adenine-methyltransferase [Chloroflexales bacterium]|nr:phage N-6-adenine-methyltransferase [Chloroflexales bacterium]